MKKYLKVFVLLLALILLVACGGGDQETAEEAAPVEETTVEEAAPAEEEEAEEPAEEEMEGLDFAEHGGNAYPDFEVSSYGGVGSSSMGPGSSSATGDTVGQFKPVQQT